MGFENVGQIAMNKKSGETLVIQIDKPVASGETLYINLENIKKIIEGKAQYTSVARRTENAE